MLLPPRVIETHCRLPCAIYSSRSPPPYRCRANMAHIRQSRQDSGFQVKVLKILFSPLRSSAASPPAPTSRAEQTQDVPRPRSVREARHPSPGDVQRPEPAPSARRQVQHEQSQVGRRLVDPASEQGLYLKWERLEKLRDFHLKAKTGIWS